MSDPSSVLVVEDESLIAMMIAGELRRLGYRVLGPAANIGEAMALIGEARPDIALLDVQLARETSYPIADALLQQRVPFAFVTAYQRSDLPERFAGVRLLRKPFSGLGLEATARALAAGQEAGATRGV